MKKDVENVNITTGNPVGTIINFFGLTAPEGYLACDGATYNRADYPELAEHLVTNFADLVGDGETTFKVPDLRGEFLRGTGTNGHSNSGSGANVGVHQDSTRVPFFGVYSDSGNLNINIVGSNQVVNADYELTGGSATTWSYYRRTGTFSGGSRNYSEALRPTNTSILYCIKY